MRLRLEKGKLCIEWTLNNQILFKLWGTRNKEVVFAPELLWYHSMLNSYRAFCEEKDKYVY